MANDQLFIDILAHVEKDPASWDQKHWVARHDCQTVACFAGWACLLSGEDELSLIFNDYTVSSTAVDLLGIPADAGRRLTRTPVAAAALFAASNTMDDLYRESASITGLDEQVLRDKVQDALRP